MRLEIQKTFMPLTPSKEDEPADLDLVAKHRDRQDELQEQSLIEQPQHRGEDSVVHHSEE